MASNETVYRPAAQRARRHRARRPRASTATPTTATSSSRSALAKHVRLRPRAHRGGLRFGQPVPAADSDHRLGRRRGALRVAQLRDLPAAGPYRRRHPGAGAADRPHLRPRRDARRDHRPHPADLRLQPEQPDQHRRRPGRADPVRRGGAAAHPGRHRRGLRRVHPRRTWRPTASGWSARTATSLCCGRFRRRTGWRAYASATRRPTPTSSPRWPRSTCRSPRPAFPRPRRSRRLDAADELLARTDAVVAERTRVVRGAAWTPGYQLPPSQANFVWLPLLGTRPATSPRTPPTAASSCAPTAKTACGSPSPRPTRTTPFSSSPAAGSPDDR